jgi:hypothetical protein
MRRELDPKEARCDWFTIDDKARPCKVREFEEDDDWAEGVDAAKVEIELRNRLVPPRSAHALLQSGRDVLASTRDVRGGTVIVVANGSFLLNAMLINHEHRKLAAALIAQIGPLPRKVAFLESDRRDPPIRRSETSAAMPTGMNAFHVWPTNWILLHLAIVGILLCFARWPVFGRPKSPESAAPSDFGKHVEALADLLRQSRDRDYARSRVDHYRKEGN